MKWVTSLLDQPGQFSHAGLGFVVRRAWVGITQDGQHAAHLRQRLQARPLDHVERFSGLGRPRVDKMRTHA